MADDIIMVEMINKEKVEKELEDVLKYCQRGSSIYWRLSSTIAGIHEGKYDVADADIEVIEISKKLDHIESMIRNYRGCKM
jgi:hypothetical protein